MTALRVMSWNVLADAYVRARFYPQTPAPLLRRGARSSAIIARIARANADVICLQEVEPTFLARLVTMLGARYQVRFAPKRDKPDGIALAIRREVDAGEASTIVFADGRGRPASGHVALIGRARLGERVVTIATTHLRWDPPGTPEEERWAIAEIDELIATRPRDAWIVSGDLNVEPDDVAFKRLLGAGLVDAYADAAAPTANPNARAKRIDYLLHTTDLRATAEPLPVIENTTTMPSASAPSDHLAIAASFTLSGS